MVLLRRYIESQVYQAVVENAACEQAARMVAMKNATEKRRRNYRRIKTRVQQSASSGNYPRAFGNCCRCCGGLIRGGLNGLFF